MEAVPSGAGDESGTEQVIGLKPQGCTALRVTESL